MDRGLELLILCYQELNSIKARDWAPPGVSEEYFSTLVGEINRYVEKETGHGAWLHPQYFHIKVGE